MFHAVDNQNITPSGLYGSDMQIYKFFRHVPKKINSLTITVLWLSVAYNALIYTYLTVVFFGISSVLLQYFFSISSVNHCRTTEELLLKYCRTDGECATYVSAAKVWRARHNKRGFSQL